MLKGNSNINNSGNNQVEEHQYRNIPVVGKTLARGLTATQTRPRRAGGIGCETAAEMEP